MKPHPIIAALASIAPALNIRTEWEHDSDSRFSELQAPGCCFENEDPEDWQAWQSQIIATAICGGSLVTGHAYLGGTWEKWGEDPAKSNPDISGYLPEMIGEALEDLQGRVAAIQSTPVLTNLQSQITAAMEYIRAEMGRRYDEQCGNVATA